MLIFITNSCSYKRATCEEVLKKHTDSEFEIIIDAVSWNGNNLKIDGRALKTSKEEHFFDIDGWYFFIGDKFQVGDTLVKKKGKPLIKLYRKNERWSFTYKCEKNAQGEDILRSENVRF